MNRFSRLLLSLAALVGSTSAAQAQSDLLVAPTRLVIDGAANGEVVVSNNGARTSTYRVSLVLRRMNGEGLVSPVDEADASPAEQAALQMITFAPRKVVLAPGQSQTVRIGIRPPAGLENGEYRAHLLFRAIPDSPVEVPAASAAAPPPEGMSIALTPIYGVTIPVIARIGAVSAEARILSARPETRGGQSGLLVEIGRSGTGSVYGSVEIALAGTGPGNGPGSAKPLAAVKGIAVYPEIASRSVFIPLPGAAAGQVGLIASYAAANGAGPRATLQVPAR